MKKRDTQYKWEVWEGKIGETNQATMYTCTLVPRSLCIRLETPGIGTNLRELGVREVGTNGLEPGDERMNSNIYHITVNSKKALLT